MSRRRYITTDTSVDKRLNNIAKQSDFTALFFLMLIPHVGDDCFLTGDPEELLGIVFPLRRDKEPEDIVAALRMLHSARLLKWCPIKGQLMLSPEAFYRYQTYIKPERRTSQEIYEGFCCEDDNSEEQRKTPQNAASFSIPLASHKHSLSATATGATSATTIRHTLDDPPEERRQAAAAYVGELSWLMGTSGATPYVKLLRERQFTEAEIREAIDQHNSKPEILPIHGSIANYLAGVIKRNRARGSPKQTAEEKRDAFYEEQARKAQEQNRCRSR